MLDEEAGIAYWYLMSCEPLNEEETSHESSTPTEGTVDNDESKSSSQSSEISEDEQDKCNRTIIASDFMLPDAAVGTQVSGTCFDVYKGNFPFYGILAVIFTVSYCLRFPVK